MASLSFNSAVFSSSLRNSSLPSDSHRHCVSSALPSSSYSSLVRLGSATSIGFDRIPRITNSKVFTSASASSSSFPSFDDFNSGHGGSASSKKKLLAALIQEIEPLDISVIQKDIPPTTLEAMKRTISGMLGLLPSNQFQVMIEALWESLFRLLLSSIMTGYTLRNAEYRLCLERNLGIHENNAPQNKSEDSRSHVSGILLDSVTTIQVSTESEDSYKSDEILANSYEEVNGDNLGEITPEAQSYILHLQSRLSSVKKELHEVKRKNAALQMQQFVGEEKNDLLDYLRSLTPEKVAELSEPSCPEVREMLQSVVHGLLAYLSPRMHTKAPPSSETNKAAAQNPGKQDFAELIEDTSLPFQPAVSLTRDYLARYLFWCMLLGHYLRGLEYRLELTELFHIPSNCEDNVTSHGTEQAA